MFTYICVCGEVGVGGWGMGVWMLAIFCDVSNGSVNVLFIKQVYFSSYRCNIFTNNAPSTDNYMNGILLSDITDHFPAYHITNKTIQSKETICIHRRKMNDSCKETFLNPLNTCDWNHVMDTDNVQEA